MPRPSGLRRSRRRMTPILTTLIYCLREEKTLLMERRKEPNLGLWVAPGGKIELGESPYECARRELYEETGLQGKNPELVNVDTHLNGFYGDVLLIAYSVELNRYDITPGDDVSEARFFNLSKRPELVFQINEDFLLNWVKEKCLN